MVFRVLACFAVAALLASSPNLAKSQTRTSVAPAGGYLPPDYPIARVGPRTISAAAFSRAFYDSDPRSRPRPDSAGRVAFLGTLVKRDLMALVAQELNNPLDFTARAELRTYSTSVLRNLLFQRMVLDSITVTEDEIRKTYDQYKEDVRVEHLQVEQKQAAERIRQDLVDKRITWNDAVQRYSTAEDRVRNGDLGWRSRLAGGTGLGQAIFSLAVGEYSHVFADGNGYHVARVAERRPGKPPAFEPIRDGIESELRSRKAAVRARVIQERLLRDFDVHYEQENLRWAAKQFSRPVNVSSENGQPVVSIDNSVPELAPEDTGRVLARYRGGQVTMAGVLARYEAVEPVLRPLLETAELVQGHVDVIILEPRMVELARERGLDRDSLAVRAIEFRREGMMVERLYADSIESRVRVSEDLKRQYYKRHSAEFITYPRIRYAAFVRPSRGGSDSLRNQLLSGMKAEEVIRRDSLAGTVRGSIQGRSQNDPGPYHKILFEEMRPGQVSVQGPDKHGDYAVLQLLDFDSGRQLSYEEASSLLDEIVRHEEEERIFDAFVARHSKRFKIETRPDLVMRIELKAT